MTRDDADGVNVGVAGVDAEAVGTEGKQVGAVSLRVVDRLLQAEADIADPLHRNGGEMERKGERTKMEHNWAVSDQLLPWPLADVSGWWNESCRHSLKLYRR
eukprot:SAG22_NODE_1690_length_3806_cov_1.980577_3_plen_102_part_00